jgi:hypothetical protein
VLDLLDHGEWGYGACRIIARLLAELPVSCVRDLAFASKPGAELVEAVKSKFGRRILDMFGVIVGDEPAAQTPSAKGEIVRSFVFAAYLKAIETTDRRLLVVRLLESGKVVAGLILKASLDIGVPDVLKLVQGFVVATDGAWHRLPAATQHVIGLGLWGAVPEFCAAQSLVVSPSVEVEAYRDVSIAVPTGRQRLNESGVDGAELNELRELYEQLTAVIGEALRAGKWSIASFLSEVIFALTRVGESEALEPDHAAKVTRAATAEELKDNFDVVLELAEGLIDGNATIEAPAEDAITGLRFGVQAFAGVCWGFETRSKLSGLCELIPGLLKRVRFFEVKVNRLCWEKVRVLGGLSGALSPRVWGVSYTDRPVGHNVWPHELGHEGPRDWFEAQALLQGNNEATWRGDYAERDVSWWRAMADAVLLARASARSAGGAQAPPRVAF